MGTVRQLIQKTMQRGGILTKNEVPSSDEENDAFDTLNEMLSSWSTDSLLIYSRVQETFVLTGAKLSYTIGSGGDFNTVKPVSILEAHIKNGTTDYNVDIVSDEIYNKFISTKTNTGIPYWLNFDNAFPLSTIRLYPVPSTSYSLSILSEKPLTNFTTLEDTVSLPAGWQRAIINNLLIDILPEYGQPATADMRELARESKAAIKRSSTKVKDMDSQPQGLITRNIYTGYNRG